jgi:hypothetical protein
VGPTVSSSYDHGHSGVDRQAPVCVPASGELAEERRMVVYEETPPRRVTRTAARKASIALENEFLVPASSGVVALPMATGGLRARARSDDEESVASFASRSSVASTGNRGKKRKLSITGPEVTEELRMLVRTTSVADVNAEVFRLLTEITRVATTSSNLKGTNVEFLRYAAGYLAAWAEDTRRMNGTHDGNVGAARLTEARNSMLVEENAAPRSQPAGRAACTHECPRCSGATPEGGSDSTRFAAMERRMEEMGSSLARVVEELSALRQANQPAKRQRSPERLAVGLTATAVEMPPPTSPRKQGEEEWRLVASRAVRKKAAKKQRRRAAAAREAASQGGRAAATASVTPMTTKCR